MTNVAECDHSYRSYSERYLLTQIYSVCTVSRDLDTSVLGNHRYNIFKDHAKELEQLLKN